MRTDATPNLYVLNFNAHKDGTILNNEPDLPKLENMKTWSLILYGEYKVV